MGERRLPESVEYKILLDTRPLSVTSFRSVIRLSSEQQGVPHRGSFWFYSTQSRMVLDFRATFVSLCFQVLSVQLRQLYIYKCLSFSICAHFLSLFNVLSTDVW